MTATARSIDARAVVGAVCWVLTAAYFVVQPVVAAAWDHPPYDIAGNSISDLGVTACGSYPQPDNRVINVCSPRHRLMNVTFMAVGVLTAAGAVLTRSFWPQGKRASIGLVFVVLAGVGGVLVGLAPANVNLEVHAVGALLQVPGAVGPALLGLALWGAQRWIAAFSALCGLVGSAACVAFFTGTYLGLGLGIMEHLAFDPLTLWTTSLGVVLLVRWWAGHTAASTRRG